MRLSALWIGKKMLRRMSPDQIKWNYVAKISDATIDPSENWKMIRCRSAVALIKTDVLIVKNDIKLSTRLP